MSQDDQTTGTEESDTNFVPPVTLEFLIPDEPPTSSLVKCTTCKIQTTHLWNKVHVVGQDLTPMEALSLTKRLLICTNCGKLSLTN